MLSRIKNSLVFQLEQLMMRGAFARFGVVLLLLLFLASVAGLVIRQLAPGFESVGDAIWWAFEHVVVPEYTDDDEGVVKVTFATGLIVLGSILFAGAVIAILVQWMDDTTTRLEQGLTSVALTNHVVILGWTHRTPTIVSELLHTGARRERFQHQHDARALRIVVLAKHVDGELVRELRERVGEVWDSRKVLLRSGTPLNMEDLERVAFRHAAVLILPGAGFAERNPEYVDAETVKTLLSVAKGASKSGFRRPLAVVELYNGRRAGVTRRVYGADSEIVVADEIVSRIIVQSVRQHGLCGLFTELFTLNQGTALYLRGLGELAGAKFRDVRGRFNKAIPIGLLRPADPLPQLSPDPDTVLAADDLLVFIAHNFDDCVPRAVAQSPVPAAVELPTPTDTEPRRVLILGWSRRVPALLWEFQRYGKGLFEVDIVSGTPIADRDKALTRYGRVVSSEHVRHIESGYTVPGVLRRLEPQGYDNIVLLASERLADEEQADAITIFAYQLLQGLLPSEGKRPDLLVELLDEENQALFQAEQADLIVSPLVVSYLLSQVSLRRELAALFAELSRPRGAQILLHPAQQYLATDAPVRFADVDMAAAARGEIALGIRRAEGPAAGLMLNPDRTVRWTPAPGDEVVVLASQAGASDQGGDNEATQG